MRQLRHGLLAVVALLVFAPALLRAQAEDQLRQAIRRYENLEIDRARAQFEQVISPTTPFPVTEAQRVVAYKYLGATMATLGRTDSAVIYFQAAISRDPLVDLDQRQFGEQERQAFQRARSRVFRLGLRAVPRDTIDPRSERVNFTVATTHRGVVRIELVSTFDDNRYTLFEGDVDGPRDIPFNGLSPRGGGLIPPGAYDLTIIGESATLGTGAGDSTSTLLEVGWERATLEDTIAAFGPNDTLPTRQPPSVATRDLLLGIGIAAGSVLSANVIGQTSLEGKTILSGGVAALGVGGGLYAFLHRRGNPEIPANIAENANRRARRAMANSRIMERNNARIQATRIIIRPLGQ